MQFEMRAQNQVEVKEDKIINLISAYIQSAETPDDMRAIAKTQNALPMYLDMGGCIALRPDKTFISHPWDTDEFKREDNPAWQIVALVYGCKKYPSPACLLPTRMSDDRACQICRGTGRLVMGDKT